MDHLYFLYTLCPYTSSLRPHEHLRIIEIGSHFLFFRGYNRNKIDQGEDPETTAQGADIYKRYIGFCAKDHPVQAEYAERQGER